MNKISHSIVVTVGRNLSTASNKSDDTVTLMFPEIKKKHTVPITEIPKPDNNIMKHS